MTGVSVCGVACEVEDPVVLSVVAVKGVFLVGSPLVRVVERGPRVGEGAEALL